MTIDSETQLCCRVGSVRICTDSDASAKVIVLVRWKDILGFDLLLDMTLSRQHWAVSSSHKLELCNSWRPQCVLHFALNDPTR